MGATHKKPIQEDSNLETFSLIWLHSSFNSSEEDFKAQQRLRISINHLKLFDDNNHCEEYIRAVTSEDRLVLIVNGRFARIIVPRIEQLRQVSAIYIYTKGRQIKQHWAEQFVKVKGVFDHLDKLITRMQYDHTRRLDNKTNDSFPVILYKTNELSTNFIYSHLLFDCLLRMITNNKNEFISLCKHEYKDNESELIIIHQFERDYSSNQALLWYTRKSFIYRILNKALRVQNIELLFILRFFIQDIFQQIEQCKCYYPIRVYYSHLMTYDEIQLFKKSIGQFISINSFLSTSLDRGLALYYLYQTDENLDDLERVLFEIDADPRLNEIKLFGNNKFNSNFNEEEQILFMLGSIFRLISITFNNDGIWIIQMTLCTEDDSHLKSIFDILKTEYDYGKQLNIFSFGQLLIRQDNLNEAEKYYHRLLKECSSQSENLIKCYDTLGKIAEIKGDYDLSIQWFNKIFKIKIEDNLCFIDSYNNIGGIYQQKGDYKRAIESYNKALTIFTKIVDEDHPKLAMCLNNIGIAYKREEKYFEALEYHQKALLILRKHRPINYSALAVSYNNMGVIHRHLGHYDGALEYYQQSLEIYKKSLSFSYSDIAKTYKNIGILYKEKGEFQQALLYFKKAATIYHHTLSSIHPDVVAVDEEIRYVSSHVK